MTCEVVRPFKGGGQMRQKGEIVDVSGWKWAQQLIDHHYLRVVAFAPPSAPAPPVARPRKDG